MNNSSIRKNPLSSIESQIQPLAEQYSSQFIQPYAGRRPRRRHRSELRVKLLQIILGSSIFVFSLIILFMWFYTSGLSVENEHISAELYRQTQQLTATTAALEKLQDERDSLIQGRLPNLLPLEYDKAIPITEKYLRNIIFTLIKNQEKVATEYRVVLQNDTLSVIHPEVKILFFGDLGIQIGAAEITPYGLAADEATLEPGEIRSYSGPIELFREGIPRYFLVIAY